MSENYLAVDYVQLCQECYCPYDIRKGGEVTIRYGKYIEPICSHCLRLKKLGLLEIGKVLSEMCLPFEVENTGGGNYVALVMNKYNQNQLWFTGECATFRYPDGELFTFWKDDDGIEALASAITLIFDEFERIPAVNL